MYSVFIRTQNVCPWYVCIRDSDVSHIFYRRDVRFLQAVSCILALQVLEIHEAELTMAQRKQAWQLWSATHMLAHVLFIFWSLHTCYLSFVSVKRFLLVSLAVQLVSAEM